jgi:hypothetical protein
MLPTWPEVVRRMRHADPNIRREFVRTPQRFFKEELGEYSMNLPWKTCSWPLRKIQSVVVGVVDQEGSAWEWRTGNTWLPETYESG